MTIGVEIRLLRPGLDIGPGQRHGTIVLADVMVQRAAAPGAGGHHDLDTQPGQQPDRGLVDPRHQHLLGTAGQQRDPRLAHALGRIHLRPSARRWPAAPWPAPATSSPAAVAPASTARGSGAPAAERRWRRPGRRGTGRDAAAAARAPSATRVPAAAGDRSARCRSARDRPGACSSRRTGTSSCRTGRTGSGRHGARPPRSPDARSPACP